ncbi:MAG: DUF4397 domain-containing protein [Angustibacter sp.]
MSRSILTTLRAVVAVVLGALASLAIAASPAQAADGATVTVVHGIPDTDVDVYVNDKKTLPGFTFKTVTDPLSLPAGSYSIDIRKAGDPASADPILSTKADLTAGANVTLVAHLEAGGDPTVTAFVNPTTAVPAGMERVIVRHTAAAPAVDVLAGDKAIIENLSNPKEKALMVPKGSVSVAVAAAGTTDPVIGPVTLDLKGASTTVVYAIGSLDAENLTAVTQTYASGSQSPTGSDAGSGGQAEESGAPVLGLSLAGAGAVLLVVAGGLLRRRTTVKA